MKTILNIVILLFLVTGVLFAQTLESPDTNILKRTPQVDGTIGDSEWDLFYQISGNTGTNTNVSTFVNWDNKYLYVCVKSTVLSNVAVALDVLGDGWLNGDDNYLFKVMGGENLVAYKAGIGNLTEAAISPINPLDQEAIICNDGVSKGEYIVEMAIPILTVLKSASFKPDSPVGINIAVQAANDENASWLMFNPADLSDNTIKAKFVTYKSFVLGDLNVDFILDRESIVAGETLDGKIRLSNKGAQVANITDIILAGEGDCEQYVNSYKLIVGDISSKKTFQREYHTNTLSTLGNGTWVLGAEIYSGDMKIGAALKSFEVIPMVTIEPIVPKPMYSDDKELKVGVKIVNYSRKFEGKGDVTIIPPEGWIPKGGKMTIPYKIYGYKKVAFVEFKVIPPIGAFGETRFSFIVNTKAGVQEIPATFNVVPAEKREKK